MIQLAFLELCGFCMTNEIQSLHISGKRGGSRFSVAGAGLLGKKELPIPVYLSGFHNHLPR